MEFLRKSIVGALDFCCFLTRNAWCVFFVFVFLGYPENAKYPPDENVVSCSSHKMVGKLAYLGLKMTSLNHKHKIVVKVASIGVSKLHISLKDLKLSGKLPFLV